MSEILRFQLSDSFQPDGPTRVERQWTLPGLLQ